MDGQNSAGTEAALGTALALVTLGHWEDLAELLDAAPELATASNAGGTSLLHAAACIDGGAETIARLIALGADPNKADDAGATALSNAIYSGHRHGLDNDESVARLIAGGADLTLFDDTGKPPLQAAIYERRPSVMAQLLAAGADPLLQNSAGDTAYEYAVRCGAGGMLAHLPPLE